jgi:hypothetical protein
MIDQYLVIIGRVQKKKPVMLQRVSTKGCTHCFNSGTQIPARKLSDIKKPPGNAQNDLARKGRFSGLRHNCSR